MNSTLLRHRAVCAATARSKKNLGPKTCKISVDFGPLQTLIANISGTAEDIQNQPTLQTMAIPPAFNEKGPVNFGPLTAWNYM